MLLQNLTCFIRSLLVAKTVCKRYLDEKHHVFVLRAELPQVIALSQNGASAREKDIHNSWNTLTNYRQAASPAFHQKLAKRPGRPPLHPQMEIFSSLGLKDEELHNMEKSK